MKMSVNTQSSIRIEDKYKIYFDPFEIKNETHDADIIFFTHSHYDHFSKEDYEKIEKEDTIFVMPKTMNIDRKNVIYLNTYDEVDILNIHIKAIPSYNINKQFHPKENNWLGYLININDKIIYVCGDTDKIDEMNNIKCDIMFIPIGGVYTMDYKAASEIVNIIKPNIVIPTHYGSIVGKKEYFNEFKKLVNTSEVIELIGK